MAKQKKTGNVLEQREQGRRLIFSHIRQFDQAARVDIAKSTGLSPATVTTITAELIAEGILEEVAEQSDTSEVRRGRPRIELKIRGAAHKVAGIKLSDKVATLVIMNLEGEELSNHSMPMPNLPLEENQTVDFIYALLHEALNKSGLSYKDLSAIGIGLPGIVDAKRGFVYWCPLFASRNVDLLQSLSAKLPLPVFIDNDTNLVALAELWFGYGRNHTDFLVVTIEHGVGMSIVMDSKVYRGARGSGAEFGHTKVRPDGALCRCGQRGCLEAYVADYALLRDADTVMTGHMNLNAEQRLTYLFEAAKGGNETAQAIFKRAGQMFATGLANLVNIFDPAIIILSGEQMKFDYLYEHDVIESMRNSIVNIDAPAPEVQIHKWGDLMWAKGAAAFALNEVLARSL
ncbi:ROK family protein [Pseudovibrio sp. Tun.PSC04-5.I4]|uniref:ROK family transcriptional regulator n=1 Tax=Pseudovibrio sp. Tun.PSC04-5.I4 TaxID=1798213 RepID=UPI0008902ADD|nr:ROK family protein [Pseudovibrio sp. Tun.PSC04-5.I4]SDR22633.1 Sugar kinase of the NBD/HSP70 family, may contain an N-terminal HTH domain [Pseudovibrio sp. Tun.PSC04-5.I4]